MQVFGLPGQIIRNGRAGSRLLAAQTPNIEAARRRDAVARWLQARADGLTAEQAAQAVGVARSNLYRWAKDAAPKSRRPRRVRQRTWSSALVCAFAYRFNNYRPHQALGDRTPAEYLKALGSRPQPSHMS